MRIIQRIDQQGDNDVEIIRCRTPRPRKSCASSTRSSSSSGRRRRRPSPSRVVADDRSNSVLVGGEHSQRLRIKALIAHLDTPLENGGDTQVRYLRYADAEKIATKLKEQITAPLPSPAARRPPAVPRQQRRRQRRPNAP